ncbi:MAG TPA: DUF4388 domain-containing protein [Polyangiaceae bacterium]|nr:DUF4388 domain-containing protein [Polyangiaceae bacterium]
MSISGNLADIAIVDLLQFVHMSQRSGTLLLERRGEVAHISFHRGRIASAWAPGSPSVAQHLLEQGRISKAELERATQRRHEATAPLSLGQALLDEGGVAWDELRDAVAAKIERTIFELVHWNEGAFRLIADEVRADDEISFAPGDVLPDIDVDTQGILLEAVRLFDERNQKGQAQQPAQTAEEAPPSMARPSPAPTAPRAKPPGRIQVLSKQAELVQQLQGALGDRVHVGQVEARDAGAPEPGQPHPLVVVDLRQSGASQALRRVRELHSRALVVALVGSPEGMAAAFADGAAAVAEASYLSACCANLLRTHAPADPVETNLRSGLGRLRRVLGDLRSGLLSATVSLNLMTIVADSVERAVLFVQQGEQLVALGAFGMTKAGKPLAALTRGLTLRAEAATQLSRCIIDGHALTLEYDSGELPADLKRVMDRPRSGQGVLFPVLGARRAIGLIYADNGRRSASVQDVELMELATAQVGLAFENELLRRQIERLDRVAV